MNYKLYAYALSPLDFGWSRMPTMAQTIKTIMENDEEGVGFDLWYVDEIQKLLNLYEQALIAAKVVGWEGDFRNGHEPRVLTLPYETDPVYAFVWKQENNGDTFVVSQVPLTYLDQIAFSREVV